MPFSDNPDFKLNSMDLVRVGTVMSQGSCRGHFPFGSEISLSEDLRVHYQIILDQVGPLLTESRREKIARVVQGRNFSNPVILEGIYDRGNVSAVMRSSEAFGFVNFHVIETQEKFKDSNRVSQGADKWVEVKKWKSTSECVHFLKDQGYRLAVTTLDGARPMAEVDFSVPTALVLGNEKDGASPEILAAADERIVIPMYGFVQSFNISVAGALCMYQVLRDRVARLGRNGDLSVEEMSILTALYYLRTQDSAVDFLLEKFKRDHAKKQTFQS